MANGVVTYTKLKSGDWGIKIAGYPHKVDAGDRFTVTKKSGETKEEAVKRVVFSGDGVVICAIEQEENYSRVAHRGGYRRYGYGHGGGDYEACGSCGARTRDGFDHC